MKVDYHVFKSVVNGYLGLHMDVKKRPTFFDVRCGANPRSRRQRRFLRPAKGLSFSRNVRRIGVPGRSNASRSALTR